MNKQEKLNKLASNLVEIQFLQLTADQIECYIKRMLYDDLGKCGIANEELVSQGIALTFEGDAAGEVQFYIDNDFSPEEANALRAFNL